MFLFIRILSVFFLITIIGFSVALSETQKAGKGKVPERKQVDPKYTWDLTTMYPNQETWEADYRTCEQSQDALQKLKGTISASPEALLKYLTLVDDVSVKLDKLLAYANMLKDQDTRQPGPQGMYDRGTTLSVKLDEASSWFEPELLAIPEQKLGGWLKNNSKLSIYAHRIDNVLRQRQHILSAREEELMAMSGKVTAVPREAYSMLANADMVFPTIKDDKGEDVQLSEGRYALFMRSTDRALRENAFKKTISTYLNYKNTMAATLAGSVQKDIFEARARHYGSALEAALAPDNVPVSVYENLIATIHNNLPKLHRYMEIRRKKLGVDKVHLYDTFLPLIEGESPKIDFDAAVKTIINGFQPLGPEYLEPMTKAFQSRWLDVYETQGKRSGAYSLSVYASHPYILLNYNDTYDQMFTVAHEMGHSMHSWFSQHSQPAVYFSYPIFVAEVASTGNEIILSDYLLQHAKDKAEKLFLVNNLLESIRGTVINQTMWAEFEKLIHDQAEKGEPLTYDTMSKIYRKLVLEYFGPSFEYDDEVDGYWLRVPHFYRGFYVYKYATSYSASTALTKGVLSRDRNKMDAYLGFLKAGGSDYPIEILKKAGVDMSSPKPIQDTMDLFGELLDQLEDLLK
jgi:oligoendopeptidase F